MESMDVESADNPAFNGGDAPDVDNPDVESASPAGAPSSVAPATAPGLETKCFWSADGERLTVGAWVIRAWLAVLVLLQLLRLFAGHPSAVAWRDLGMREQIWLHELGRNVTSEQAVLMEGINRHEAWCCHYASNFAPPLFLIQGTPMGHRK